jgi:hypothetical protein
VGGASWLVRSGRVDEAGRAHLTADLLAKPAAITRADAATVVFDAVEDPALARTAVNVAEGRVPRDLFPRHDVAAASCG